MPDISEKIVAGLPVPETGNKLFHFSGSTLQGKKAPAGFAVSVTSTGTRSFVLFYRHDGKAYLPTLGRWDGNDGGGTLSVKEAIIAADALARDIKSGRRDDPRPDRTRRVEEKAKPVNLTISGLLDIWFTRYVEGQLRSATLIKQTVDRLVKPAIGDIGIYDLKRSMIAKLLDDIADNHGEVMANRTLAYVRKAFSWYEVRGHDDNFRSPIVRGMQRSEHARDRILTDDEIRALWKVTGDTTKPFEPMLRFILLTACRRMEAAAITRSEVKHSVWTIPASRYKTKTETVLPLSQAAQDILASMPRVRNVDYIFTRRTVEQDRSAGSVSSKPGSTSVAASPIGPFMTYGGPREV
jgi:integrase